MARQKLILNKQIHLESRINSAAHKALTDIQIAILTEEITELKKYRDKYDGGPTKGWLKKYGLSRDPFEPVEVRVNFTYKRHWYEFELTVASEDFKEADITQYFLDKFEGLKKS